METVRPAFALLSNGEGNILRHPHPDILDRLVCHQASIWRTDLHGLLTVISDGHSIRLTTHSWPMRVPVPFAPCSPFECAIASPAEVHPGVPRSPICHIDAYPCRPN